MEGSSFLKKVRDARAEGIAAEQKQLEAKLPTPPGMSIDAIKEAAPLILSLLEEQVLDHARECTDEDEVTIQLSLAAVSVGNTQINRPSSRSFGDQSEWWTAICAWADTYFPKNYGPLAARYNELTKMCFKKVRDIWNEAHPDVHAWVSQSGHLSITIPKEEKQ